METRTTWIELEDTFLIDVPTVVIGRGKNRKSMPDPTVVPKNYYLFAWTCKRTKTGKVSRRRRLETLDGEGYDDLDAKLEDFIARDDVILVGNQDPLRYGSSRSEPVALSKEIEPA
jgi:hypothetical protein